MYNKRCWAPASDSRALSILVRCIFWDAQYVWNVCAVSFEMQNMFQTCVLHLWWCKVWWQRRMWDAQPQLVEQLLSVKVPDAQFDCCWMHFWWSAQCVRCQQCIFCGSQCEMLSLILDSCWAKKCIMRNLMVVVRDGFRLDTSLARWCLVCDASLVM